MKKRSYQNQAFNNHSGLETTITQLLSYDNVDTEVTAFFLDNDSDFYPPLTTRGSIESYIRPIFDWDGRLVVCRHKGRIIGIMGVALNHPQWKAYFAYIAVHVQHRRSGIADILFNAAEQVLLSHKAPRIMARTWSVNQKSPFLLCKNGFFHLKTLTNDRDHGVHTFLFAKPLNPNLITNPVTGLCIIANLQTANRFIFTLMKFPRSVYNSRKVMPIRVIDISNYNAKNNNYTFDINHSDHQVYSHVLVFNSASNPYINMANSTGQQIIDIDSWTIKLMHLHGKNLHWLVIGTERVVTLNFKGLNFRLPGLKQQDIITTIANQINLGAKPTFYAKILIDMALENNCNALLITNASLHNMFEYQQQVQGIYILDPLAEMALQFGTCR